MGQAAGELRGRLPAWRLRCAYDLPSSMASSGTGHELATTLAAVTCRRWSLAARPPCQMLCGLNWSRWRTTGACVTCTTWLARSRCAHTVVHPVVHRADAATCSTRWLDQDRSQRRSRHQPCMVAIVSMLLQALTGHLRRREGHFRQRAAEVTCETGDLQAT